MQIRITATPEVVNKGKYNQMKVKAEVDGRRKSYSLLSFGDSEAAFKALKGAESGSVWEVTTKQNGDYENIVAATEVNGIDIAPTNSSTPAKSAGRSNYETPEERAQRQIFIIRQSSAATAAAFFAHRSDATEDDVFNMAERLEKFCLRTTNIEGEID